MTFTVRRVRAGLHWPVGTPWDGASLPDRLNPLPCPAGDACVNGWTAAAAWLSAITDVLLQAAEDVAVQQRGATAHPYLTGPAFTGLVRPSADLIDLVAGLTGREPGLFGYDSSAGWRAAEKIVRAAGLPSGWGICPACDGHRTVDAYPGQAADREAWQPSQPPSGTAWQLWDGSIPVTAAYATAADLALSAHARRDELGTPDTFDDTTHWITTSAV